ncbi:MAG: TraB/GumN family protein [Bacteroidota bacterium]
MKNFRAFLFLTGMLVLFTGSILHAQNDGEKTVLWEISGKDLPGPSYLFGTIHVMPAEIFRSFPLADQKLKESQQLVLEMVMDVPLATQVEWAKKMMLPDGGNLRNLIPEDQFGRLRTYVVDSLGVKEKKFERYLIFKPFAFYSALIPDVIGRKLESYEMHYTKIARDAELPVLGLETFEYQLAIFDSIPMNEQVELFFGEQVDMKKEFAEMIRMYEDQDIYGMAEALEEENASSDEMEFKLITQRNHNWVVLLSDWMRQNPSFIAVGAGHLAGDNGLIRLFREAGYVVNPVMLTE